MFYYHLGGTVDITVHKIVKNGIEDVIESSGGPWGGNNINQAFSDLLEEQLGKDFVGHVNSTKPSIWHTVMIEFEKVKRSFDGENDLNVTLPFGLGEAFEKYSATSENTRKSIRAIFPDDEGQGMYISDTGCLVITAETLRGIFSTVVDSIYDTVITALDDCPDKDKPKYIFLVGGFSDCKHIQAKMKTLEDVCDDPKPKVITPLEASLCVLKGAVLFGHDPDAVKARMSKYTYAFLNKRPFKPNKDDPDRCETVNSKEMVEYLEPILKKGSKVPEGFFKEKEITVDTTAKSIPITVYMSRSTSVDDPRDSNVKSLGSVVIEGKKLKGKGQRTIKIYFIFGKSELEVRALDTLTKEEISSSFDFESKDDNCVVM